jgi:hypothetical protein
VVPPVLQPWTLDQAWQGKCIYMGCRIYIHFHLRPCVGLSGLPVYDADLALSFARS